MPSPDLVLTGYDHRPTWRARATAALLTLGIMALFVLALLQLGLLPNPADRPSDRLTAIALSAAKSAERQKASKQAAAAKPKQVTIALPHPVPTPVPTPPVFIKLSHTEFAAADIANLGRHSGEDSGGDSGGTAVGPGEGPGGARLYNAQWYREPTNAELNGYLKAGAPPGSWALIACQTVERYHVDNCQQLDESPRGSGLARAMRQAAWQFLVRPPRLGGKPIPGAWVRIRIDFARSARGADTPTAAAVGG
ncbi:MAG TPA: hypothetical protein VHG29_09950 [Novosphingobium sp.]|nr:hypothetical protein [Novosphingobium sp.]